MTWNRVCRLDQLPVERAVAALVGSHQVAIVRLPGDEVAAVDHHDPVSGANVMARGIVGSAVADGELVATLASPMYKEAYDLRTGRCLGNPAVSLTVFPVRIVEGWVEVGEPGEVSGVA